MIAFPDQQAKCGRDFVLSFFMLFMGDINLAFFNTHSAAMLCCNGRIFQSGDEIPSLDLILFFYQDLPFFWHIELIMDHFTLFDANEAHVSIFIRLDDVNRTLDLGYHGFTLGLSARFEEFLHAR